MEESIEEVRALFKSVVPKTGVACVYCGDFATDKEHVTPRSWIEKAEVLVEMGILDMVPELQIVPSCRECNCIAAARIFDTFADKKAYIRWRLTAKYRRWLDRKQWTDEELDELRGDLRRRTILYNEVLKAAQHRLRHINARAILKNSEYFKQKYG